MNMAESDHCYPNLKGEKNSNFLLFVSLINSRKNKINSTFDPGLKPLTYIISITAST